MPAIGDVLAGRYRIVAPLGAGGMATVHRAHDERLDRDVAVKILLPNHAGDPALATRFEREARSLAAAAHPGVVAVYDVDPGDPAAGQEPFFVMELCPGGSLADRLSSGQPLAPDDLVPILISVADGLAGLHGRGVIHRDVKPSNILLASDRAKLADFGLARSDDVAELSELTAPGTAVGTLAFLAPEVLGGAPATAAADVYALGVAAFAGLTGSLPRPATSLAELVANSGEPSPAVSSAAPSLGPEFDGPVAEALSRDPGERPDAIAFASAMTAALGRWSRTRSTRQTLAQAPPPRMSETDLAGTTALALPAATTPAPPPPADSPSPMPARTTGLPSPALLAASAVVILGAFAIWAFAGGRAGQPGSSIGPTGSLPAGQSSPPPSAEVPSASPAPSAPSVASRALAALDDVTAAISAAGGGSDGLKGKDRNELERAAAKVRSALEDGKIGEAQKAANELADKVEKVSKDLNDDRARQLRDAVAALVDVLAEA